MTKNNFSGKLKELRLKNKYTQKFVADFLGLTQRQYQYCEQGHIPSQFNVVIKMCMMYGIDANELFGIEKKNVYPTPGPTLSAEYPLKSNALVNMANISNANTSDTIVDGINNHIKNRIWGIKNNK
nr:MAG TPA: helix-turn-helix domain protein [Caudoviricetes sp.]